MDINNCCKREIHYYNSIKKWREGKLTDAANELESCLLENPLDILSSRILHDIYSLNGDKFNLV